MQLANDAINATSQHLMEHATGVLESVLNAAGTATAKRFNLEALIGNGNNQYKRDNAVQGKKNRDKVSRATTSHKPVSMRAREYAGRNERQVARMIGGTKTDDNLPMDNVVYDAKGKPRLGVEIKTLTVNSNDKITMHPESLDRKEKWAKDNKVPVHTVVIDDRKAFGTKGYSGHRVYHREGVGSFRLHTMTRVKSAAHLRKLMRLK